MAEPVTFESLRMRLEEIAADDKITLDMAESLEQQVRELRERWNGNADALAGEPEYDGGFGDAKREDAKELAALLGREG